jgi:murein DD-endopeptidase MepM/ murein hydrolase activator NlpD
MKIQRQSWLSWLAWFAALAFSAVAVYLGWRRFAAPVRDSASIPQRTAAPTEVSLEDYQEDAAIPDFEVDRSPASVQRMVQLDTLIPNRARSEVVEYTVSQGDSVFGIAYKYGVQPETVLWSNYDLLRDDPHSITVGMDLKIPPVDGIYYQWEEGDILESVATEFNVEPEAILTWTGNRIDLTDPQIEPGTWVMVPGGQREFQQWIIPVPARSGAGVSTGMYGSGACPGGYEGTYGTGGFVWPTDYRTISGNDYWSGHLAIDIGVATGGPIMAADSGVIMFAGWAAGGYGYTVAIDHGNGYQTLYAHLSSVKVSCGQSVQQGQLIGFGGSTGNSTGPHLHFEVRYQGGFVNPWYVLPAP